MSPGTPPRRRRWLLLAAALVVVLAGAGVAAYLLLKDRTGDISHPGAEFTEEKPAPKPKPRRASFVWPNYGYDAAHTRVFDASPSLRPPFRQIWRVSGEVLLEFPPAIAYNRLYQLNDFGTLRGISMKTGRVLWRRKLGKLAASTPAVHAGVLYVSVLSRTKNGPGRFAAIRAKTGRTVWIKDIPSRTESSPLYRGGRVYAGSEDGTVYCLRARSGRTLWTYKASGAVKGSPTFDRGVLYFGDYGGQVHAVYARSGRRRWATGTSGAALGFRSGTFYATAAVRFGRVFIGNTDGREYSFVARTGKLAWAKQTGNYVYASAAVDDIRGLGPTVYVGSYDGSFYALNARTGDVRWSHQAGGKISGSSTVVGRIVYFANLAARSTVGLDVRTGRRVFSFPRGGFDPVISDGKRIYLTGYDSLQALEPRSARRSRIKRAARRSRARRGGA